MAAPTATEVCRDSQSLRDEAERLRRDAREQVRLTRGRLHTCLLAYARTSQLCAAARRSPWSELEWEPAGADLDQVRVPR